MELIYLEVFRSTEGRVERTRSKEESDDIVIIIRKGKNPTEGRPSSHQPESPL